MSNKEFIESIAPDVINCLNRISFFEKLDDRLCPAIPGTQAERCGGDFRLSESILRSNKFTEQDLPEIFAVLHACGACCDCEVLYNVAEENRLKATYWRAQAQEIGQETRHHDN